jgi:hypothetical protein
MRSRYVFAVYMVVISSFCSAGEASKILGTAALSQIEGQSGGGIVPWATIGGYGSEGEWGAGASSGGVQVSDLVLDTGTLLLGFDNRWEFSFAQQTLQVNELKNGPFDAVIQQHIYGVKYRVLGHLIYEQLPQVSLGVQQKFNMNPNIPIDVLGANSDRGTDVYISASKLWLHAVAQRNLLVNVTGRYTDANQTGLLGFGNADGNDHQFVVEASAALFINQQWAVGGEFRQKPDRLASVDESAWWDAFVAWFPNKRIAIVGAYVDLGTVALWQEQRGGYLSIQITN